MLKLTKDDVEQIMNLFEDEYTCAEIADIYGMSRQAINDIRTGRVWNHVTNYKKHKVRTTKPKEVLNNRFNGSLTQHARRVFIIMLSITTINREKPLKGYTFLEYRADLNHTKKGEEFTVFKAVKGKQVKYVCYGSDDTLYRCSWDSLVKRL